MSSQFLNICKWQVRTDAAKLLKMYIASVIINVLVLFGSGYLFDDPVMSVTDMGDLNSIAEVSFCYSALQLFMLFAVSRLIAPMTDKKRRVAFMMMPATIMQKFTMRVVYLSVFCVLVWAAGFVTADAIHVAAAKGLNVPGDHWATPAMIETCKSNLTTTASPGEAVELFMKGMEAGQQMGEAGIGHAEAVSQSMQLPEELTRVKSFAEAGWLNVGYGILALLFSWAMCLFCGALFRSAPWVFAWLMSFFMSILLAVIDYFLGLGKPLMMVLYAVGTVLFVRCAYTLFKNTQVIHNKLLNL